MYDAHPERRSQPGWQQLPRLKSRAEALAAFCATAGDHTTTTNGGHAGTKSMTALAHQLTWLIGPFHGSISLNAAITG